MFPTAFYTNEEQRRTAIWDGGGGIGVGLGGGGIGNIGGTANYKPSFPNNLSKTPIAHIIFRKMQPPRESAA
jgi:hypothetical protein